MNFLVVSSTFNSGSKSNLLAQEIYEFLVQNKFVNGLICGN